ncbi:MAG: hypothetical protein ACLQVX_18710 [Limisphaerales bacterium]
MDHKDIPHNHQTQDPEEVAALARLASYEKRASEISATLRARAEQSQKSGDAHVAEAKRIVADLNRRLDKMEAIERKGNRDMNRLVLGEIWRLTKCRIEDTWGDLCRFVTTPFQRFSAWRRHRRIERLIQRGRREVEHKRKRNHG